MSGPPDTDALIQKALRAEEAERKAAKAHKQDADKQRKAAKKGKTLEQIETEEGGPIKESMVGMAHTKRAAKRKGAVDDTDLVEDVEGIEEDLEQEEEDGIKLEAFNLKEERQKGYFDDSGNYVERDDEDAKEDAKDAWLQSDEAKVVSEEVRRKIEAAQQKAAAEEAAGPLSATQIARLQLQASEAMQAGESVAAALKRLGGHSRRPTKHSRRGGDDGAGSEGSVQQQQQDAAAAEAAKAQFQRLTEAAMKLMDAGENDVYSQTKDYFELAASVYIDLPGPSKLGAGPSKAAYEDADEDMFASDEEKEKEGGGAAAAPAAPAAAAPPAAAAAPPPLRPAAPPAPAKVEDQTDYSSWPIKELRRFLSERGVDGAGIVEKAELIAKVKEVAARPAEGEAPAGYSFDPASGLFHSAESGMYWDASTGGFFNNGKWYSWDADKKEFEEWAAGEGGAPPAQ
ncbi:CD2 antigen cytoplasmic tail-binding 2 [Micractinium conductrix]|uniref:CD2 antigen cytoplasmic tail-binding 2 n=1 Tax=Micractinium conductrix TaxID=554055 RepID=A0A2P6VJT1_9CHLO|nr:CD2 antigen cytoplasmic tail-binding 2 [Micractinium conductrix]|eukprot:PSC74352.1 CD2 antigen cytoplasmic tail-binding 2 [Micractinium conductrix]